VNTGADPGDRIESVSRKGTREYLESIIDWSKALKPWEREAIRRLVVNGELTEPDVDDIIGLIKAPPLPRNSRRWRFPTRNQRQQHQCPSSPSNTRWESNAPCPWTGTEFRRAKGLTVIYGDKWVRQVWLLEGSQECVPLSAHAATNPSQCVLRTDPSAAAKAEFVFLDGTTKITEPWTDGSPSSEVLAALPSSTLSVPGSMWRRRESSPTGPTPGSVRFNSAASTRG